MTQYRLLRNNKESGPYSEEQLVNMGLKAYDLVWIEGRSAGWRYPSEIDEFKAFAPAVEEQPFDRFYKKPQQKITPVQQPDSVTPAVKKEKPRFRISADWRKVEAKQEQKKETVVTEKKTERFVPAEFNNAPAWEQVYNDWQQKTPVKEKPVYNNVQSKANEEPEILETKFSQSLDDIKERYAETVLKPKEKKGSQTKEMVYAIALILLIVAAGFLLNHKFNSNTNAAERIAQTKAAQDKQEQAIVMDNATPLTNKDESGGDNNSVDNTIENNTTEPVTPEQHNVITNTQKPVHTSAPSSVNKSTVERNSAQKNVPVAEKRTNTIGDATKKTPAVMKANSSADNSSVVKTRPAVNETTATETEKPKLPVSTKKSIDDYVVLSGYNQQKMNGIQNVNLTVSNVADFPIDLVVIDVHYYNASGRYQKGETLYVKNIGANQNINVKVPDSPNSSSINYKVSMLTAEQKTLYLISD
ncbi:MAG: hypothetical protein ACTHJ5_16090 [Ilyomonas sp.]